MYGFQNQRNKRVGLSISAFRTQMIFWISFILLHAKIYFFTGMDRPLDLQEVKAPGICKQPTHEGGKFVSPTHRQPILLHAQYWKTRNENSLWSLCPGDPCIAINILFLVTCDSFQQVRFRHFPFFKWIEYRTLLRLWCSSEYSVRKTTKVKELLNTFYGISSGPGMTHICIKYTSHLFLKFNKIVFNIAVFLMIPFFYWTRHFVRKNSRDLPPISTILILKHAACFFLLFLYKKRNII
jgi:hypothetical protein